jgi:hypothetical protein
VASAPLGQDAEKADGTRAEWRPVPNRPGIPQYTEAPIPISARVALCEQYRNARTGGEAAEALAKLTALHRAALHPNPEEEP